MESQEPSSKLWKWVGTVFAAFIAPVIAGVAVNMVQKAIDKAEDPAETKVKSIAKADPATADQEKNKRPAAQTSKDPEKDRIQPRDEAKPKASEPARPENPPETRPTSSSTTLPLLANASKPAASPAKKRLFLRPIRVFNGIDLTNFYTWTFPGVAGRTPGKNRDSDKVFSVKGGELHLSGAHPAALISDDEYGNYHLAVVYRWGETPAPPHKRSGGIILHYGKEGPDGQHMSPGIRCNLAEDGTGNLTILAGPDDTLGLTAPAAGITIAPRKAAAKKKVVRKEPTTHYAFRPGGAITTERTGTLYRFGYFINSTADEYRPGTQFESEMGSLNRLDIFCVKDQIAVFLNEQLVNYAVVDPGPQSGRIAVVCEYSELFIKQITLRNHIRELPVPKILSQKKPSDLEK